MTVDLEGVCGKSFGHLSGDLSVGDGVKCCVIDVNVGGETVVVITDEGHAASTEPRTKRGAKYKTKLAVSVSYLCCHLMAFGFVAGDWSTLFVHGASPDTTLCSVYGGHRDRATACVLPV